MKVNYNSFYQHGLSIARTLNQTVSHYNRIYHSNQRQPLVNQKTAKQRRPKK